MKHSKLIELSFKNFNSVSATNKQVKNIEKFTLKNNFDSLDILNLYSAFDEILSKNGFKMDLDIIKFKKKFKNYKTIITYLENEKK